MPAQEEIVSYFVTFGSAGLAFFLLALWFWRTLSRKHYRPFDSFSRPLPFAALLPFAYVAMIGSLIVDAWWHLTIGRDDFWVPPHLMVIASLATILLVTVRQVRALPLAERFWHYSVLLFAGAFVFGFAFDDTVHRLFGPENVSSALIFFSPPHLFLGVSKLFLGFTVASVVSRISLRQYADKEILLLLLLVLGATFAGAEYLFRALFPYVSYQILGIYGSFFIAAVLAFFLATALRYLQKLFPATLMLTVVAMFLAMLRNANFHNPGIEYNPSAMPPVFWLLPVSLFMAALAVDVLRRRPRDPLLLGLAYGATHGTIFYAGNALWFSFLGLVASPLEAHLALPVALAAAGGAIGFWIAARTEEFLGRQKNDNP